MLFLENIKLALFAIKANKLRSFLTMLGIIIGISSVISITAIGASAQAVISKEFDSFGAAYMYIMPDWRNPDPVEYADIFSIEDIEALKNRFPDDIKYAERYHSENTDTKIGRIEGNLLLYGVGADFHTFYKRIEIVYGRGLNKSDIDGKRENVVIDIRAARFFFNKENVVGNTIPVNIRGTLKDLTVVGVYEEPPSILSGMSMSTSYTCYVPISLIMNNDDRSFYIEIYANENKDTLTQAQAFGKYMERIKGKPEGFYMSETADSQLAQINTILGTLSVALGIIAGISLLVGGIGIMNIMLVSVTERTREIGIRKSLGARTKDILTQFLIEAMILSCIGGIIGTTMGITLAGLGMSAFGISVVIQPVVVLFTVLFSAGVGLFFGIFPARKAAVLDPIEALRYE